MVCRFALPGEVVATLVLVGQNGRDDCRSGAPAGQCVFGEVGRARDEALAVPLTRLEHARRLWLIAFMLIGVACAAWTFAYPRLGGPDESQHAIRAAAVVRGELLGRHDDRYGNLDLVVDVPESYGQTANVDCYWPTMDTTPTCMSPISGSSRLVSATTYEFRGPFLYYAVVGVPTLPFPSLAGIYLMRLVNALLCAALLASALTAAVRVRSLPLLVGVFVAITPEVLFLGGVINSNSVEAAAGICLWTALVALLRAPEESWKALIRTAGIAAVVLVASRGLSPLFLVICITAIGLITPRTRLRQLLARRDIHRWALVITIATVACATWTEYVIRKYPLNVAGLGWSRALTQIPGFGRGAIGDFVIQGRLLALRQVPLPVFVYLAWATAMIVLLGAAVRSARRRELLVLAGLIAVSLVVPVAGAALGAGGQYWVGRHVLAIACGIPILTGIYATPHDARATANHRSLWFGVLAALVAAQVLAFGWTLHRYIVGGSATFNPLTFLFSPTWSPPLPPALLVAVFTASLTGLAITVARYTTRANSLPTP